jgi:oxygen-independent coproporphyrinogen-3 oxidase
VRSIDEVIGWGANELYLYPLYVRPLTILGKLGAGPVATQAELYRAGRDHLRALGWRQRSMRLFQAPGASLEAGPAYRCQEDGMIGLGPGARSYTTSLHYASGYAVGQTAIRDHISAWSATTDFALIGHGFVLDGEDQRRRFAILSLLDSGLDEAAYARRFATTVADDLPMLAEGLPLGLLSHADGVWRLTDRGIGHADVIGRWLFSRRVEQLMETWTGA